MYYWVKDTKYYRLLLQSNLFGSVDVVCCWGSLRSRNGGYKIIRCDSQNGEDINKIIASVKKRREARGYKLIREYDVQ